jgi:hypothetical protein
MALILHLDLESTFRGALQEIMNDLGQDLQRFAHFRQLVPQPLHEDPTADPLAHPFLEDRLGGVPQVQVGVELAPEALDIEQRLLAAGSVEAALPCRTAARP